MAASSTHCSVSRPPLPRRFCSIFRSCLRLRWQLSFRLPVTRRPGAFSSPAFSNFCWSAGDASIARSAGEIPLARARRRCAAIFPRARAGDSRLGRRAARAVRRHDHCKFSAGRRIVCALLCRPAQPVADRRHRHRRRHRHPSRNVAPYRRRRSPQALRTRRTAPSNSRCCCRFRVSRHFSSSPI